MRILSVNVGNSRAVTIKNRTIQTGIYKVPVDGPVRVTRLGLEGDAIIEKRKMGLENNAVYAYPFEHYAYWEKELGRDEPYPIGKFGENLTVTGLLEEEVRIGDIFRFGNAVLQVTHPRIPCNKLNARMGFRFAPMFLASRKVGYYFRVLEEGTVEKGDSIELLERDEASPTMEEFVRVTQYEYWDEAALQHLLQARDLMPDWREIIEAKLTRARTTNGWHGLREFKIIQRDQESDDTVSLTLKCVKGRPLASFHGGQQLMVALGGRGGGSQQRKPYFLSSSPADLSSYRITLKYDTKVETVESDVSSYLAGLTVGEQILCNAPYGAVRSFPEQIDDERIAVLICQGTGIAPMLSLLYELEGRQSRALLLYQHVENEPTGLLAEANGLIERNPGFEMINVFAKASDRIGKDLLRDKLPLAQSDIEIAGSRSFVEFIGNELMELDISPAAVINYAVD